jgi:hypothetical protein
LFNFIAIHYVHFLQIIDRSDEEGMIFVFNSPKCDRAVGMSEHKEVTSRVNGYTSYSGTTVG